MGGGGAEVEMQKNVLSSTEKAGIRQIPVAWIVAKEI